jgi:hypothetical protein
VTVHASATRERNEQDYNLARYVDVEIRCITYAEPEGLLQAREAHFNLVACVYHTLAQADTVSRLNGLAAARVAFWSCYAMTDAGGVIDDLIIYRIAKEEWMVVTNAATIAGDEAQFRKHLSKETDFRKSV